MPVCSVWMFIPGWKLLILLAHFYSHFFPNSPSFSKLGVNSGWSCTLVHLLLTLKFDKGMIFPVILFPFSGKGTAAFSPSHPLLPLRQKQQKSIQGEDIPGKNVVSSFFP